jgi:glycosyltransferase involved in cell wall biosynthesis
VVDWGSLDVVVLRSLTLRGRAPDVFGLSRCTEVHIPYDSLLQLCAWKPDIVISGELGARSLQAAAYCALQPGVPLLIWATLSEHTESMWGGVRQRLRQTILQRADGVLVNGEGGARYIRRFGLPEQRIFRVNQPVDGVAFSAAALQRTETASVRLLISGMLAEHKGVRPFVTSLCAWALSNMAQPVELLWLGDGPLRPWLEQHPLPASVSQSFLGAVQYADVPAIYAKSDVLVLPSLRDEWGLVVNEAMASGLPVLGSIYSQAVEELVEDGRTGWIFDPLSSVSTHAALDRVFATSPAALLAMRQAARQRVSNLTPASTATRIAGIAADLLTLRREVRSARR